ncbi:hypothetical protein LINPERPRIM_LOCUS32331 [Linum perenne]
MSMLNVDKVKEVKSYNWCKHVLTYFKEGLRGGKKMKYLNFDVYVLMVTICQKFGSRATHSCASPWCGMWEHDVVHNELGEMAQKGKGAGLEQFIEIPAELNGLALQSRYLAVQERIENNLKILRQYLRLQIKGDEGGPSRTRSNEDVVGDMGEYREIIADVVGTYTNNEVGEDEIPADGGPQSPESGDALVSYMGLSKRKAIAQVNEMIGRNDNWFFPITNGGQYALFVVNMKDKRFELFHGGVGVADRNMVTLGHELTKIVLLYLWTWKKKLNFNKYEWSEIGGIWSQNRAEDNATIMVTMFD